MTLSSSRPTRREFLTTTSGLLGGLVLGAPVLRALPDTRRISLTSETRRLAPQAWLSDPTGADTYRALAQQAIDAARQAGAAFADIRIGDLRQFSLWATTRSPDISSTVGYGIRALVDGAWGFMHGAVLTPDAITSAAREAVTSARGYASTNAILGGRRVELVPVPAVTGEWVGPAAVDPFAVPVDDHLRVLDTFAHAVERFNHVTADIHITWVEVTRVFASTDGSLVTQRMTRFRPEMMWTAAHADDLSEVAITVPGADPASVGFETLLRPDWLPRIEETADTAVRLCNLPLRPFNDVGRFPVVLDGGTAASILGQTISSSLEGDRVAGWSADATGTSFLSPPATVLGATQPMFSPLLTVTADRALPAYTSVKWDDEGIAPEPITLIDRGRVRDYHLTRETAMLFASAYRNQNRSAKPNGTALAMNASDLPSAGGAHVTLTPNASHQSLDMLTRDIKHGFAIHDGMVAVEPGLTSGMAHYGQIFEIVNGVAVARVPNVGFHFRTKHFWGENLGGLGDHQTMRSQLISSRVGIPWQDTEQSVTAPAILAKEMDVVSVTVKL